MADPNQMSDEEFIAVAIEQYHEGGVIEIDSNAVVSRGDPAGAYVQAWVWVDAIDKEV